ncbi:MAG: DUF2007 domain-containing protein [Candidatus Muiribacteriota bacterium]
MKKILKTFSNHMEADFFVGVLKANKIDCFIEADDCGGMAPHLNVLLPIKLYVDEKDFGNAQKLLDDFEDSSN